MTKCTILVFLGLATTPAAFGDQDTWQERRREECTERAYDRQHLTKDQEFVDFCVAHSDVEVKRYWSCASRADRDNLGTDSRETFLEWCVKKDHFADADADRFSYCNARAINQKLKGDERAQYVNGCVERGE
jgi:hypothetical protein